MTVQFYVKQSKSTINQSINQSQLFTIVQINKEY